MSPVRVGYLFNHERIVGGGELSFLDLVDAVRAEGVEPIAVVPGAGEVADRLQRLGVRTQRLAWPSLRGAGWWAAPHTVRRLTAMARELGLALLHADGARCMLFAGPAARRVGLPCVWHVRVLDRDGLLDRFRARRATAIVANAEGVATTLRPLAGRTPVRVVANGVRLEAWCDAAPADLHRQLGLGDGPLVLGVGRLTAEKRFEDLIAAGQRLGATSPGARLVLVGSAPPGDDACAASLRRRAAEMGVPVAFAGWRDDVPACMAAAAVLALPATREAFGRVVIEAWAAGLPVVAAAGGGPAELIRDGVDGLLYPGGDVDALAAAVERVLSEPGLAAALAAAGRERAPEFSLAAHARRIREVYEGLLGGGRG